MYEYESASGDPTHLFFNRLPWGSWQSAPLQEISLMRCFMLTIIDRKMRYGLKIYFPSR